MIIIRDDVRRSSSHPPCSNCIDQAGIGGANAICLHRETGRDYALQVRAEGRFPEGGPLLFKARLTVFG